MCAQFKPRKLLQNSDQPNSLDSMHLTVPPRFPHIQRRSYKETIALGINIFILEQSILQLYKHQSRQKLGFLNHNQIQIPFNHHFHLLKKRTLELSLILPLTHLLCYYFDSDFLFLQLYLISIENIDGLFLAALTSF